MIITNIESKYVEELVELVLNEFEMEQKKNKVLGDIDCKEDLKQVFLSIVDSVPYGKIAVEQDKAIGFLAFYGGFENQFGKAVGCFSPLCASAFGGSDRAKTASMLFQSLSLDMVKDGITSFAICKYAHDNEIADALSLNGFGIRCADAVKDIQGYSYFECKNKSYTFNELKKDEVMALLPLKNALQMHLSESPTYFLHDILDENEFAALCDRRKSRFFVAKDGEKIIGYIEVDDSGETFVTEKSNMQNLCGMYLDKDYRGTGIADDLLSYVSCIMKNEKYSYLSVDYETINPTALRFWGKNFSAYTYSFVRRIDERIVM